MRGFLKAPLFLDFDLVPEMGLEPIWIAPFDFKSNAYTNSATRALFNYIIKQAIKKSPWLKARGKVGAARGQAQHAAATIFPPLADGGCCTA